MLDEKWVKETIEKIDKKLQKVAVRSREKLPYSVDENGVHDDYSKKNIGWWTNGFWGGIMWLMYAMTKNEEYKKTALKSEELLDGALKDYDGLHHDVGFMWHILSGANYKLNGDKNSRVRNLYAANVLAGRFNIKGGYIKAWNGSVNKGKTIIDTMMNLPLLYWAAGEIGEESYSYFATAHADMAMRDHVREDGSVRHIIVHEQVSPKIIEIQGGQGYDETSSWSRGCAWAIYGFIVSYLYTKDEKYLETAMKTADHFIESCKEDWMPVCDFRAPKEPVMYDSTAAACASCGMIEIAKALETIGKDGGKYLDAAKNLIETMSDKWCNYDDSVDYILGMGTARYHNRPEAKDINAPIIYGDYFYIEALLKLSGNDFMPW